MGKKDLRSLKTFCVNQDQATVLDGEAIASPPKATKI